MKNKIDIKIWMLKTGVRARQIAREYGCSDAFVSAFLDGLATSNPLADFLIQKGCPKKNFKNGRVAA